MHPHPPHTPHPPMLLFRGGPVLALFLFGVCCTTMVSPENGAARTVKFSVDSLGDPADFFASALAYDDGNEDDAEDGNEPPD